jgi:hypothetical protein
MQLFGLIKSFIERPGKLAVRTLIATEPARRFLLYSFKSNQNSYNPLILLYKNDPWRKLQALRFAFLKLDIYIYIESKSQ